MNLKLEIILVQSNSCSIRLENDTITTNNNNSSNHSRRRTSDNKIILDNVTVGNGNSTIKWLSLMASHQVFSLNHCRCRGMRLLPNNVYTQNTSFLHPDHKVKDVLSDGETVQIELCNQVQLGEKYNPIYHPWCTIAFFSASEDKSEFRQQLIKELQQKSMLQDQEKLKLLAKKQESINKPKILKMKEILKDQFLDADEAKTSMQHEWGLIIESGVLDSIADTLAEKENIRTALETHFAALNHIYKYYSAVNSQGGTHTLEFIEFSKLINDAEILDSGDNTSMILTFFGSDIASEVKLWQFMVSFLKIAVYKYITLVKKQTRRPSSYYITKKKQEEENRKRQGTTESKTMPIISKDESQITSATPVRETNGNVSNTVSTTGAATSPSEAFLLLFQNYLKNLHDKSLSTSSSTAIDDTLKSNACLLLLYDHLLSLGEIFCLYAQIPFFDKKNEQEQHQQDSISSSTLGVDQHLVLMVEEHVKVGAMNIKQFSSFGSIFMDETSFTTGSAGMSNNTANEKWLCSEDEAKMTTMDQQQPQQEGKGKYVTMTDIRQIFSLSQNDKNKKGNSSSKNTSSYANNDGNDDDSDQQHQFMVFPEFIESVIHLSMLLKWNDESVIQSISKILYKIEEHLILLTSTRRRSSIRQCL